MRPVGIGQNDLWIAATAWVTKAALITTDSDFDHLHPVFLNVIKYPV
jgi:predicted nucleic acid-binding protein